MTMYELSPIVMLPPISRSRTMYEMRNIHEDRDRRHYSDTDAKMTDDVITEQKPLPEYSALEMRQEKILNQLAELKKQVSTLCHFLKQSNKTIKKEDVHKKGVNINIQIKVAPGGVPYSLLILRKLWKDTDFRIKAYTHSTVKKEVSNYFSPHNNITSTTTSTIKNIVNITLIWKNVPMMETRTDLQREPLLGQVNFLRYLYRMIDTYENDSQKTYLIDNALDLCYVLSCRFRCKGDIVDILFKTFDEWSGKDKLNIADIAVWSTIQQDRPIVSLLSDKIQTWYKTIDKITETKTLKENYRLFLNEYYYIKYYNKNCYSKRDLYNLININKS